MSVYSYNNVNFTFWITNQTPYKSSLYTKSSPYYILYYNLIPNQNYTVSCDVESAYLILTASTNITITRGNYPIQFLYKGGSNESIGLGRPPINYVYINPILTIPQTLAFTSSIPTTIPFNSPPITLSVTTNSPVATSYQISQQTVICSLNTQTNILTINGNAGQTCTIMATNSGNSTYANATATLAITITKINQPSLPISLTYID